MPGRRPEPPHEPPPRRERGGLESQETGPRRAIAAYFLSKYELTQAQWLRVAGANPSSASSERVFAEHRARFELPELHPVETVSAFDGVTHLRAIGLRLPSDLEWELAAFGAGPGSHQHDGPPPLEQDGLWHQAVVRTLANPFGLQGIAGNVWEWCAVDADDPEIASQTGGFAICGGSYRSPPDTYDPSFRSILPPERRQGDIGLRPARSIDTDPRDVPAATR
jgi:formylglycine-generating enzyme required for sulfatase activity